MPLISPLLTSQIRRHWQVAGAVVVFAAFSLVHVALFQPTANRFRSALKRAGDSGLVIEDERSPQVIPPRVLALLTDNALPSSAAGMERESGALTATLLEDVTQLTTKNGMQVLATEPGPTSQDPKSIQVRARLRIRCSHQKLVAFLDDLSRSNRLIAVDRFSLTSTEAGQQTLDLWVTRFILKQTEPRRRT